MRKVMQELHHQQYERIGNGSGKPKDMDLLSSRGHNNNPQIQSHVHPSDVPKEA